MVYLINFLLAISTTIGMTLVPILVTDSLALSFFALGLIEGSTEFLSSILRLTNGVLFDKIKNKRYLFVISTTLAFFAKVVLLVPSTIAIVISKMMERMANGSFAAPRDAYVSERAQNRGMALGLVGFSKSAGCILGPLLVSVSTIFWGGLKGNETTLIMLCCVIVFPAFLCSFTLDVKELEKSDFSFADFRAVFRTCAPVSAVAALYFFGRFNDGLLVLYLKSNNFPEWFYLSTISIFNLVMMLSSPIIGRSIDAGHLRTAYRVCIGALAVFGVCFLFSKESTWTPVMIGLVAWGVQRTGAQIVFSALFFKRVAKANFGTAIGIFHLVSGFSTMLASILAGIVAKFAFWPIFLMSVIASISALVLASTLFESDTPRASSYSPSFAPATRLKP